MIESVETKQKKQYDYPMLMKAENGAVILAIGVKRECLIGVCLIKGGGGELVGCYTEKWNSERFKPLEGDLVLRNAGEG